MGMVLVGLFLEVLIMLGIAFVLWLPSASLSQIPTKWATRPIDKIYGRVNSWANKVWTAPGGHVRVLTWIGALCLVALAVLLYEATDSQHLPDLRAEAGSIAIAVIVIDELARYRNHLEYKRSIIRQMASKSNDFALDAARIMAQEGWVSNGSLRGADLRFAHLRRGDLRRANFEGADLSVANLEGAVLMGANLEGANLSVANLKGTNLLGVNFEGANLAHTKFDCFTDYNDETKWPAGFVIPNEPVNVETLSGADQGQRIAEQTENRKRILRETR